MKKLYFDCAWGISGDMVLEALRELAAVGTDKRKIERELGELECCVHRHGREKVAGEHEHEDEHAHVHGNGEQDHSHRSYKEIKQLIDKTALNERAKEKALDIYAVIAAAEAQVHETSLEDVHFHEVGRDRALLNVLGAALYIDMLDVEEIYCGVIYDGTGFVDCSHGRIPVPVPAVMAMRKNSTLQFGVADVETELVTPTGLAMLIGMGAAYKEDIPEGKVLKSVKACGSRKSGSNSGLTATLFDA